MKKHIKTCEEIHELALQGKSVYVKAWKRSSPAAFLVSWQAKMLIDWIRREQFSTYSPLPIVKKAFPKCFKN